MTAEEEKYPGPEVAAEAQARGELLLRKEAALEALNMRIARLSIALGLELDTDAGLQQALEPGLKVAPHQHPFLEELRALLTLRYQMEKQWVDEVGDETLHTIISDVEQHMDRIGFRHGMDGLHPDQLFETKS